MIRVGIVGATGYGGCELIRFLLGHPQVKITWVSSRTYNDMEYSDVYRNYFQIVDQQCIDDHIEDYLEEVDLIFFATPQGVCAKTLTNSILEKVKIIDLSADYRLKDVNVYEQWYGIGHASPEYIDQAVYGLCELNRNEIKGATIVANPGCYTTCAITTIYPLVKAGLIDINSLIIDAKSGVSGAGRSAKIANLYCEVNENLKAYALASHRHTPEIEEQLGYACHQPITLTFSPHLVPMNRGILITAYASLNKGVTKQQVDEAYAMYQEETFVRVLKEGVLPETRNVRGSNYLDINYVLDARTNRIIMLGSLDNLVKGAAGQAIQNMNILFGYEESLGLLLAPAVL